MTTVLAVLARATPAALALLAVLPPAAAAADKTIRIGAPLPLTGPLSPEGLKQKRGYDLWAETANRAGGVKVAGERYRV